MWFSAKQLNSVPATRNIPSYMYEHGIKGKYVLSVL